MGAFIAYLLLFLAAVGRKGKNDKTKKQNCALLPGVPNVPIPVVIVRPSQTEEERFQQERKDGREIWKGRIDRANVIVLSVYALFTIGMWWQMRTSTDAAIKTANTALKQLEMSERSWVGQSGPITLEFFTGNNNQPAVNIHLLLENFGHSPAISVFQMADLVPNENLVQAADLSCRFARTEAGIKVPGMVSSESKIDRTGQTIFPQQKWAATITSGPVKSRNSVLYVVGCVIYRDDVTDGIWWTRFCQETPWLASSYKSGEPLVTCNVYNETGKYEKIQ